MCKLCAKDDAVLVVEARALLSPCLRVALLNVRLDAVVHLVLDVVAVALLYESRR